MARGRGLCAVLVLTAALGCAREAVPAELIGRWTSDDPRYAGRSLSIGVERISFGLEAGAQDVYRAQGVERDTEADPAQGPVYRLYYDAAGEPERELRLRVAGPDRLEIENHAGVWSRATVVTGG
jgi:hypothetical protein